MSISSRFLCCAVLGLLSLTWLVDRSPAQGPRVLPDGKQPDDQRLEDLKDLNGYFPFKPPGSRQQWAKRAEQVRRRMLVSQGLWPMPTAGPLNAVVHGRRDMGDYTIEKAYFESAPGFFVTGNLYRPKSTRGRVPGVLCPHGHWRDGRFYDAGEAAIKQLIEQGGERYDSGRSHLQARSVQLARMGCVVFHYDMIGYADSNQISYALAHRFATQRPEMNSDENWGLFSPQAESHLQSVMGLQTLSSVRALDFLCSLPDVDPERLAVTGASGGGTQTFMVSAVDPRPAASFPAVMVSTAMQGGCTCENACLLRVGTGNVEIAALFAPKAMGLSAADDWTKEMQTKGFPELQQHYKLLGQPEMVKLASHTNFGHNYNYVSRSAMYDLFNKHLRLGISTPIEERDYQRLTRPELTVWDDEHPKPDGGDEFERKLLRWWTDDTQRQLAALQPTDAASMRKYRQVVGGGIDVVIGRGLPDQDEIEFEQLDKRESGNFLQITGLLRHTTAEEELPLVFLYPKPWAGRVAIWIHPDGKDGLYDDDGRPRAEIQSLLDAGISVAGVDLLMQGEFLKDGERPERTRRVGNPRESAAYTFGYNSTLFARRVHDVLTLISFVRHHEYTPEQVDLVGLEGAGPWVAAARAQARDAVTRAVVDTQGFRFGKVDDLHDVQFLPGGAKYHDLPGMLAVSAPDKLWLSGEGAQAPRLLQSAYQATSAADALTVDNSKPEDRTRAAVRWLINDETP